MIKRILLATLFILCISFSVRAFDPVFEQIVVDSAESTCDDCSGTLAFSWHVEDNDSTPDVTLGTPCGCSDTDEVGAETGSPTYSTAQKTDGARSLLIDAQNEHVTFDNTVDLDDWKITFDIYITSYPSASTVTVWHSGIDANNRLAIALLTTGDMRGMHKGQGSQDGIDITLSTGQWYSCEYRGKTGVAGNDHYIACDGGAGSTEEDDDHVAATGDASSEDCGEAFNADSASYYIDNIKRYSVNGTY